MLSSVQLFVNGIFEPFSGDVTTSHAVPPRAADGGEGRDLFGQYVDVYQSNEFLSAELKSVNGKLARTRAYLETPGSNPVLAGAYQNQLRSRHSAVLTLLRANRLEARALLARTATVAEAEVA